jgi:hypothetical protein
MASAIGPSNTSEIAGTSAVHNYGFVAALVGFLCLMVPTSGVAHSGGLDKIGCHHDRKKGGYHCHRGPLAGQAFSSKEEALKALEKKKQDEAESKKDEANSKRDQVGQE